MHPPNACNNRLSPFIILRITFFCPLSCSPTAIWREISLYRTVINMRCWEKQGKRNGKSFAIRFILSVHASIAHSLHTHTRTHTQTNTRGEGIFLTSCLYPCNDLHQSNKTQWCISSPVVCWPSQFDVQQQQQQQLHTRAAFYPRVPFVGREGDRARLAREQRTKLCVLFKYWNGTAVCDAEVLLYSIACGESWKHNCRWFCLHYNI